jgi:hypothetical protein
MLVRIACAAVLFVTGCSYGAPNAEVETAPVCGPAGGPWTRWPEAKWVRQIVEAGGYRVVGETGSALVAAGKGHEFYIWATEFAGPIGRPWRRMATVRGVPVYGDRDLWRVWQAQRFTFWVQAGPRRASVPPAAGRLAPVIEASRRLPFRDDCERPQP